MTLEQVVFVALLVFGVGLATGGLMQRYRWVNRKRPFNRQPIPGCEDVFPIGIGPFRQLIRLAGKQKAAELSSQFGRPISFSAQDGEDMLLADYFDYRPAGFFVEIGAYDGLHLSNTYFFEQLGWRGLLIEPLPDKAEACRSNRPNSIVVEAAVGRHSGKKVELTEVIADDVEETSVFSYIDAPQHMVEKALRQGEIVRQHTVALRPFEDIAKEKGLSSTPIDFISIDCEGMDFEVLQTIDLVKWQPCLLIIEKVDEQLLAYLEKRGFEPYLRIRANTIFGRKTAERGPLTRNGFWRAVLG